jgi:tRNA (cytidine/uridine-2'-O-)-methyltransferase
MYNKKISLAAFEPDIPQNVGALMRLCVGMDIDLHIIEPCGFVWDERKIKQSAMDYRAHAKVIRHNNWEEFISSVCDRRIVLLTTKTNQSVYDFQFQDDDVLLLGRESAGVPDEIHNAMKNKVIIPMRGQVRSFNVAMSGAIVIAEALRQVKQI